MTCGRHARSHVCERRKQVELLKGAIVLTAQERPEGLGGGFREDLFKKLVSADAVFGRLPYQILTRPLQLTGWKRMECNRLIRFRDVTSKTFDSIRRRCLVIRFRSRFVDPEAEILKHARAASAGVFPRQMDLKDFLKSGPGVLAGLRIQHGFEKAPPLHESLPNRSPCQSVLTSQLALSSCVSGRFFL
jgi:hypothetical protein